MHLSEQLQNRRKEMNLTQEEVAKQIYVSRQTISNWENGRTLPDINSLVKISDIYQISLDSLIKGDGTVIKNLERDSQQANNWFISSCLLSTAFSLLISHQSNLFTTKFVFGLLLIQTIFTSYICISGFTFLKKNKEIIKQDIPTKPRKVVIDILDILYVITILSGAVTVIVTLLIIE